IPWEDMVLRRSYSIATIPGESDNRLVEIAATEVPGGRATGILFGLRPGDRLTATGPFGRFVPRDDPPARYILLATGTGVSPYRAMLPTLRERLAGDGFEARVVLGVRRPEELLFGHDFEMLAGEADDFEFEPVFSRYEPGDGEAGAH